MNSPPFYPRMSSSRKIRRTRTGGPSPAGWGRWDDRGHAGPRWRGVVQLTRRSRRRVDRGTLQGESAIVPGFALLTPTRKGWRTAVLMLTRLGPAAKMPFPIHPHMLRHSTGFKLANQGVDTRSLQHYLGHKNIQHTVRYSELSPERFRDFWKD